MPNDILDVFDRHLRVNACLVIECNGKSTILMPDDELEGPYFTTLEVVFNVNEGLGFYVGVGQHQAIALVVAEAAVPVLPSCGPHGDDATLDDLAVELSKHPVGHFSMVGTPFLVKSS